MEESEFSSSSKRNPSNKNISLAEVTEAPPRLTEKSNSGQKSSTNNNPTIKLYGSKHTKSKNFSLIEKGEEGSQNAENNIKTEDSSIDFQQEVGPNFENIKDEVSY